MFKNKFLFILIACLIGTFTLIDCKDKEGTDSSSEGDMINGEDNNLNQNDIISQEKTEISSRVNEKLKNDNVITLDEVLELWEKGQIDPAINNFVSLSWENSDIFKENSVFRLKETDILELPDLERISIVITCLERSDILRSLIKRLINLGNDLKEQHKTDAAKEYFTAIYKCGQILSKEENMEIVKNTGKAITKIAQRELEQL